MGVALDALRYDAETVVFSSRVTADTAEQALLNTPLELDDRNSGRRSCNLDWDLADGYPWDADPEEHPVRRTPPV